MFCPQCGSPNDDSSKFCQKCGGDLAASSASPLQTQVAETRIRGIETSPGRSVTKHAVGKSPVVAPLLSFALAGIGQFYNGDLKKGAVMLAGAIIGGIITSGILYLAVWIWSMIDAYNVASGKTKMW